MFSQDPSIQPSETIRRMEADCGFYGGNRYIISLNSYTMRRFLRQENCTALDDFRMLLHITRYLLQDGHLWKVESMFCSLKFEKLKHTNQKHCSNQTVIIAGSSRCVLCKINYTVTITVCKKF